MTNLCVNNNAIELINVCKKYPHFELSNINLKLETGNIVGLIGPNGAGKSTTIRILMGLIQQDQGTVTVLNNEMPKNQVLSKHEIGYASEDLRLFKKGTLSWHIDFMKSIYPQWDSGYSKMLLKKFDLIKDHKIEGLSHGQRVKAALLLTLARRPKLLILDEPTTGLDPVARHEILNELMDVMLDDDRSILFSSQNTQDIEQISDQITFIDKGSIIQSQDKESYLDSWRRIRLEVSENIVLPHRKDVIEQRRTNSHVILTAKNFDQSLVNSFENSGAVIQSIENMTLEEIFVSEVQFSRSLNTDKEVSL